MKLLSILFFLLPLFSTAQAKEWTLSNQNIEITIGPNGELCRLCNAHTGHNYASSAMLWRMYYDATYEKEIEILGSEQTPVITSDGNSITILYNSVRAHGKTIDIRLKLNITLEQDKVRFSSDIENSQAHTVVRELEYPLVGGIVCPADHSLYISEAGGKLFSDPIKKVNTLSSSPYKKPEQIFRQLDVKYGAKVFMNCFGLFGKNQGLYFGSHDPTFQDTWHGIRVYKDKEGEFTRLECGFYKYPHCFAGQKWSCSANVVAPYSGTWHTPSRIYRRWVDTWWDWRPAPKWVQNLNSWQRVIFKHQYGEYFFRYSDLNGRVRKAGNSAGCNGLFLFGWWKEGMDHGNPDYSEDDSQGGDEALKKEIEKFQKAGNHLILYYNGKLIDRQSRFYLSGEGPKVCRHDNTGSEILERYKFTGQGTWLGEYDQRTFAVATMMNPRWNEVLFALQDRAHRLGAHSVFFDQLGYIEKESTDWDTTKEFPVPDIYGIRKRAEVLKLLRERYRTSDPDFALGAEGTVDALCQYCDYTHGYPANDSKERFINFFRYTFPEIIFTDRGQRDDVDALHHVNCTVLDGQRNDIEIWRCRGLIDDAPLYQAYLKQVNAIKTHFHSTLLEGRYNDVLGFTSSNSEIDCRAFIGKGEIAVVCANQQRKSTQRLSTLISVPGYRFIEAMTTSTARVDNCNVDLGQYDMAVLLFKKE